MITFLNSLINKIFPADCDDFSIKIEFLQIWIILLGTEASRFATAVAVIVVAAVVVLLLFICIAFAAISGCGVLNVYATHA